MTSGADAASSAPPRKRPADRREVILSAAARSFAQTGFHASHLSQIADEAGISAPALYRHFAGKYELFAAALLSQAQGLSNAIAEVPADPDPRIEMRAVLRRAAGVAYDRRDTGNVYRREPRMLQGDDRRRLAALRQQSRGRLIALLRQFRPTVSEAAASIMVTAILSIVASPVTHRVKLGRKAAVDLLCMSADAVLDLDLPCESSEVDAVGLVPLGKREAILTESIRLFAEHGFHEVTMDQIGRAVDLPPSGVYRHFPSKTAILVAALWRGSERTTAAISSALAQATTPEEALDALARQYASLCVSDPDIMTVYLRDMSTLDATERRALRRQQRLNVDEWATWFQRARPEMSASAARFIIHAALNTSTDVTVGHPEAGAETVGTIAAAVMRGPTPPTDPTSSSRRRPASA